MSNVNDRNDPAEVMQTYLMGLTMMIRKEFGGSLNGTRIVLPSDARKWMPGLLDRLGLSDSVKQQYGQSVLEVPGFSFLWPDEGNDEVNL
jgi:hypothetical protein